MAVLIEGSSIVIRADSLVYKFHSGWDGFEAIVPNKTISADNELVCIGCISPQDVEAFIEKLESNGLTYLLDDISIDIAVVDQLRGIVCRCDWLEFGRITLDDGNHKVAACRMVGSDIKLLVTPIGWEYEKSLSNSHGFVPKEHLDRSLKYIRHEHEGNAELYQDSDSRKDVYLGRAREIKKCS